ncbi:MAG: hypothetical protein HYR67_09025 [Bacteroidetes bacterium]|nr:hypothetical protein [Bacteroidota bacterium]
MSSLNRFLCFVVLIPIFRTELYAQFHLKKQEAVKVIFYYNATWELTTLEKSFYRREAYFDLNDMVFDGLYSDYKDNKLIADGIYNHGIKTGIHSEYSDHSVKTKVEYSGDDFTIWEWNDGKSDGVKNGNGKFSTLYFYFASSNGQITAKQGIVNGEFQNGRRVGRWMYYDLNKSKMDKEIYVNGSLSKRVHYSKQDSIELKEKKSIYLSLNSLNTEILMFDKESFSYLNQYFEQYVTYPVSFERNVTYPHGLKQLLTLLTQAMALPERNIEVLRLKIDEHGQVAKAVIVRSINSVYDNLTNQIFEMHQNRLMPAMKNGKPVPAVVYLPIASGEEWMRALEEMQTEWFLDYSNFMD